jgi:CRISPR-associated protein Csb1
VEIDVNMQEAINEAGFDKLPVTDVFWPREELYREGQTGDSENTDDEEEEAKDEAE